MTGIPNNLEIRAMQELREESKLITKINQNYSGSAKTVLKILYYVLLAFVFDFGKTPSQESISERVLSIKRQEQEQNFDASFAQLEKAEEFIQKSKDDTGKMAKDLSTEANNLTQRANNLRRRRGQ